MNTNVYEHDAYLHAARALPRDRDLTIVDVGANVGWTAVRARDVFPRSHVHAFEPVPDVFPELAARAERRGGITPVCAAVGDRSGTARMSVTRNRWCSSLLEPSDEGRRTHPGEYETESVIETDLITLDEWAAASSIASVDLLKLDVQGAELSVLRGAERVLATGVGVILAEAQIAPEYVGAATLTDIDAHLRDRGYTLTQIHTVGSAGADQQTTHIDALWLHPSARRRLIERPSFSFIPTAQQRLKRTLQGCAARGDTPVALFGAGQHTRRELPLLRGAATKIIAIADDDRGSWGSQIAGVPVVDPESLAGMGVRAIVISSDSDALEATLWARAISLGVPGARVVRLYDRDATGAFAAGRAPGEQTMTSSGSSPSA